MDQPLSIKLVFTFIKSAGAAGRLQATVRQDVDNLVNFVLAAVKQCAFYTDETIHW